MDDATAVAAYWDKAVGSHLTSVDHWEANKVVEGYQWNVITGSPSANPVDWFFQKYGPFKQMASICCGSGVLERHVAGAYLQNSAGSITGYDISSAPLKFLPI
jgi:hypothetical protein